MEFFILEIEHDTHLGIVCHLRCKVCLNRLPLAVNQYGDTRGSLDLDHIASQAGWHDPRSCQPPGANSGT